MVDGVIAAGKAAACIDDQGRVTGGDDDLGVAAVAAVPEVDGGVGAGCDDHVAAGGEDGAARGDDNAGAGQRAGRGHGGGGGGTVDDSEITERVETVVDTGDRILGCRGLGDELEHLRRGRCCAANGHLQRGRDRARISRRIQAGHDRGERQGAARRVGCTGDGGRGRPADRGQGQRACRDRVDGDAVAGEVDRLDDGGSVDQRVALGGAGDTLVAEG